MSALPRTVIQTLPDAETVVVDDGFEAFKAYRDEGADFLITDNIMPGLDGIGLLRRLRETEPRLPVLMVSAKPETRAGALAAGASWFSDKTDLLDALPELLRQHTRH